MGKGKENLKTEILHYIVSEMEKGHSLEAIKKVLYDVGHDPNIIEELIDIKEEMIDNEMGVYSDHKTKTEQKSISNTARVFFLFIIWAFVLILFSALTAESIGKVLLGLLPWTLTFILIAFVSKNVSADHRSMFWLIPLLLVIIFYVFSYYSSGVFQGMDIGPLVTLNLIFSYLYVFFLMNLEPEKDLHHA